MVAEGHPHRHDTHDWHQPDYVGEWVAKNEKRPERSALIQTMLAKAGLPADAQIDVLDVGGGYGFVSAEVLKAFPKARVTLQDYSAPMIARARDYLAAHAAQMDFSRGNLTDRAWTKTVGGPFDMIVSAIAIHNLRSIDAIAACYRDIRGLLKPGGIFLDCDHFAKVGGAAQHAEMLRQAGFGSAEHDAVDGATAFLVARV